MSPEDLNPWGFPKRALDTLAFDCFNDKNDCYKTQELREDFKFLVTEVLEQMTKSLENYMQEESIDTLNDLRNATLLLKLSKRVANWHHRKKLSPLVKSIAMISLQNKSLAMEMETKLWENFVNHFATFDVIGVNIKRQFRFLNKPYHCKSQKHKSVF